MQRPVRPAYTTYSQRGIAQSPNRKSFTDMEGTIAAAAHGYRPPSRPRRAGLGELSGRGRIGGSDASAGNPAATVSAAGIRE